LFGEEGSDNEDQMAINNDPSSIVEEDFVAAA